MAFGKMVQTLSLVLFVVASVGCGKSKIEKKSDTGAVTPDAAPQGGGRAQGRTVAPNQPGVSSPDQAGAPAPAAPPPSNRGGRTEPGRGNEPGRGGQTGGQTGGQVGTNPGDNKDNANTDSQEIFGAAGVKFDESEALKTGGQKSTTAKSSTPYFFTGASKDGVLERLKDNSQNKSEAEKSTNSAIASAIQHAKLGKSREGHATLSLELQIGNELTQKIRLKAESENSEVLVVSKTNRPAAEEALHPVGGQLICLDVQKRSQCSVQVAKVNFTNGSAYIIFRKTVAMAHAEFVISDRDYKYNDNQAFNRMKDYVLNRVQHVKTDKKVKELILSSFEVVGGESELGVILTTEDKQMATFKVPLVAEAQGVNVSHRVTTQANLAHYFDIADLADTHVRSLLVGIDSVRLVKNNGRGDIMLQLKFDKVNSADKAVDQSVLNLTLARSEATVNLEKLQQLQ